MVQVKAQQSQQNTSEKPSEAPESTEGGTGTIRSGTSLFALARGTDGRDAQAKQAFMGEIRQRLAQLADEAKKNGDDAAETESLAANSATRLFLARRNGIVSADELTGLLGDIFGYKPKQDGTPGRTPAGVGEAMRKRIVRGLQGWDFAHGGDGGRFFETMSADDVAPIVNSIGAVKKVKEGDKEVIVPDGPTVWHAYKLLGDLKSQGTVRIPFAFDPKKIVGLMEALSEAGAREKLLGNPPLLKAYGGLFDQLQVISTVDESEVATIKARLGGNVEAETETETEVTEEGEQVAA